MTGGGREPLEGPEDLGLFVKDTGKVWSQGMELLGPSIRDFVAYFYSDDGLVHLTQPERLHRVFDVLAGLFVRVDFRRNTRKTVIMDFQTCYDPSKMSMEAYERRTTGTIPTFQERQ